MTDLSRFLFILLFSFCCLVNTAAGKIYYGKAVPVVNETIESGSDASYYGTVKSIAKRGSLIKPRVTDLKDKTIIPGTIVLQQGTKYWKAIVDANEAELEAANEDTETAKINLDRFKQLVDSKAESVENYQYYLNDYYRYLGLYIQDKGNLMLSKEVLESRTLNAPFEGYVSDVLYTMGRASGNPPTIKITQLNPMGIKVKMPRSEANKINAMTPVTIYLPKTNTPRGIYNGYSILSKDGIIFLTENQPEYSENMINPKIKYETNNLYPVEYFYVNEPNNKTLAVPVNAIKKDKEKYYAWRAQDRKFLIPGNKFNPVFQVEKVYFKPGNLKRMFLSDVYMRSVANPGKLNFKDVLICQPPDDMKEGDTVTLSPYRYIIMPGETVKVKIGK